MKGKLQPPVVLAKFSELVNNRSLRSENISFLNDYNRYLQSFNSLELKDRVAVDKAIRSTILYIDYFQDMKCNAIAEYIESERGSLLNTISVIEKEIYLLEKIHKSLCMNRPKSRKI